MQRINMLGITLLLAIGVPLSANSEDLFLDKFDDTEIIADTTDPSTPSNTAPSNNVPSSTTPSNSSPNNAPSNTAPYNSPPANGSNGTRPLTPAERQESRMQKGTNQDSLLNSPRTKAQSKMFSSPEHEETYKTLSPKNRGVFDSLNKDDQKKIIQAYQNGDDPQRAMMKILQKDQKAYEKERDGSLDLDTQNNLDSPASRAMRAPTKQEDPGPESQVFEPGIE